MGLGICFFQKLHQGLKLGGWPSPEPKTSIKEPQVQTVWGRSRPGWNVHRCPLPTPCPHCRARVVSVGLSLPGQGSRLSSFAYASPLATNWQSRGCVISSEPMRIRSGVLGGPWEEALLSRVTRGWEVGLGQPSSDLEGQRAQRGTNTKILGMERLSLMLGPRTPMLASKVIHSAQG